MDENTPSTSSSERDDERGQDAETPSTDEFLAAIDDTGGTAGTRRIADYVGCSYETAAERLRQLETDGRITSKEIANARAWRHSSDEER